MKRHTCIICKKKRYTKFMTPYFLGWVCRYKPCMQHNDLKLGVEIIERYRKLTILKKQHLFGK